MTKHAPLVGLLDPYGFPTRPDCVAGWVIQVDWIDLQPDAGGRTASSVRANNRIDQALTQIASYTNSNAAIQARGRALKLKIGLQRGVGSRKGSERDPTWLRTLCGTVQMENPVNPTGFFSVTKWWESVYAQKYADLIAALADKYNNSVGNNGLIAEIVMGGATAIFAEPFLRHTASATNRTNLLAAGYTQAKDRTALQACIDAHMVFDEIPSSVAFNQHQYVKATGSAGVDLAFTLAMMDRHKANLGPLAVIENNSYNYFPSHEPPGGDGNVNKAPQGLYGVPTGTGPAFTYTSGIFSFRGPHQLITEQTEQASRLNASDTNLDTLLTAAKNQGVTCVELGIAPFPYAIPGDTGAGAGTTGNARVAFLDAYNTSIAANWTGYPVSSVAPSKPGAPTVSVAATATAVTITWAASTDANGDASYYRVQRSEDGGTSFFAVGGNIPFGTNTFVDSFAPSASARSFKYRARCVDAAGNDSGFGGASAAITIPAQTAPDTTPPTTPTNVVASLSGLTAPISWDASTDTESGVDHYEVWQEETAPSVVAAVALSVAVTDLGYTATGLVAGHTYKWTVYAQDVAGNRQATGGVSNTVAVPATPTPPTWPVGAAIDHSGSPGVVTLSWPAATGADHYDVNRDGGFTNIAVAALVFIDTTVEPGSHYVYTVTPVGADGLKGDPLTVNVGVSAVEVFVYGGTFEPPTALVVPRVVDAVTDQIANRLLRHFRPLARGQSVLRVDGAYVTVSEPTAAQIESATEYYAGGHVYVVDRATAAALEAAGYEVGD